MKIKILVACHKPCTMVSDDVFCPIQVGKDLTDLDLGILKDSTGDNISNKNRTYCEMTAVYWAWKNLSDVDYIGLGHYRRLFTYEKRYRSLSLQTLRYIKAILYDNIFKPYKISCFHRIYESENDMDFIKLSHEFSSQLKKKLSNKNIDILAPSPIYFSSRNVETIFNMFGLEHIRILKSITKELFPSFYPYLLDSLKSNKLYAANMFVMRRDVFDDYCNIIFTLLKEHERQMVKNHWVIKPDSEGCFSRTSGYLAEMITSAYIYMCKAKGGTVNTVSLLTPGHIISNS